MSLLKKKRFCSETIAYTKAWQLLTRLPIKIRNVVPGQGVLLKPMTIIHLQRSWNGRLEDKFVFRSAVRDLVVSIALRHWLIMVIHTRF